MKRRGRVGSGHLDRRSTAQLFGVAGTSPATTSAVIRSKRNALQERWVGAAPLDSDESFSVATNVGHRGAARRVRALSRRRRCRRSILPRNRISLFQSLFCLRQRRAAMSAAEQRCRFWNTDNQFRRNGLSAWYCDVFRSTAALAHSLQNDFVRGEWLLPLRLRGGRAASAPRSPSGSDRAEPRRPVTLAIG